MFRIKSVVVAGVLAFATGAATAPALTETQPEPCQDCGSHRISCRGGAWCCDRGTPDNPICCADTNGGCVYCSERGRSPY